MRRVLPALVLAGLGAAACGLKVPLNPAAQVTGAGGGDAGSQAVQQAEAAVHAAGSGGTGVGTNGTAAVQTGRAAQATAQRVAQAVTEGGSGLFASETEGLTDSSVTICTHIPITGAAPLVRHPARWGKFYFDYVNSELGGVHGRKVNYVAIDDQYYPAGALAAVEQCRKMGTFLYVGAAGTDQIVAVSRSFAAANRVPYLAGPAAVKDIGGIPQVKMSGPDYEYQHVLLARYMVKHARELVGKDRPVFGMIRINSPYFTAGHDAFVAELRNLGYSLAVDKVVQKDENQFSDIMLEMQRAGVDIINNFTTPNIWIKLLKQNNNPAYQPLFTAVSPAAGYNLIAAALADARAKAVLFHHFNPPFPASCSAQPPECAPPDRDVPWYGDLQEFMRIFRKYSPERDSPPPDDFDYAAYLGARTLHRVLQLAGRDLTRSKLWQTLATFRTTPQELYPVCPADFPRGGGSRGAWSVNVFRLEGAEWKLVEQCIDRA